jgi:chromosome partitioning protein
VTFLGSPSTISQVLYNVSSGSIASNSAGARIDKNTLKSSIYNVLISGLAAADAVIDTHVSGLRVLPATTELAAAEQELVSVQSRETVLKKALGLLSYDVILIDCPPSLGLLSINALVAADSVLVPVQTEFYALEGLGLLMQTIKRVQAGLNPGLQLQGVVMTMVDSRNALSGQVIEEVKKHFGEYVFSTYIPRNVRLAQLIRRIQLIWRILVFGCFVSEHTKQ